MDKIVDIFNKIGKVLGITLASLLIILLVIKMFVNDPQYYKDNKKEQKIIQTKVDSIYLKQDSLVKRIDDLEKGQIIFYGIISESNQNQLQIQKELKKIRNSFHETINNVDRYTRSSLDSFYRARYKGYYEEGN